MPVITYNFVKIYFWISGSNNVPFKQNINFPKKNKQSLLPTS